MNAELFILCYIQFRAIFFCAAAASIATFTKPGTEKKCLPGQEPLSTSDEEEKCMPCLAGFYSENSTNEPCKACRPCEVEETVIMQCTPTHDFICQKDSKNPVVSMAVVVLGLWICTIIVAIYILIQLRKKKRCLGNLSTGVRNPMLESNSLCAATNEKCDAQLTLANEELLSTHHISTSIDSNLWLPLCQKTEATSNKHIHSQSLSSFADYVLKNMRRISSLSCDFLGRQKEEGCETRFLSHTNSFPGDCPSSELFDTTTYIHWDDTSLTCSNLEKKYIQNSVVKTQAIIQVGLQYLHLNFEEKHDIFENNWQFQTIVDYSGGVLEKSDSAIQLVFPKESLPEQGMYFAKGSVYTCRGSIRHKLQIPNNLELASPLAEYALAGNSLLKKHAIVRMPTCVNRNTDRVIVYCFQSKSSQTGTIVLHEVPLVNPTSSHDADVYFSFEPNGYINIHTRHFTGFIVCKECGSKWNASKPLFAALFGKHFTLDDHQYATLRLYIIDNYYRIKDCLKTLEEHEERFGRVLKECKEIDFNKEFLESSTFLVRLELAEGNWRHRLRRNNIPRQEPKVVVSGQKIVRCCQRHDLPKSVEWELENVSTSFASISIDFYVDILMINKEGDISDEDWLNQEMITISWTEGNLSHDTTSSAGELKTMHDHHNSLDIIVYLSNQLSTIDAKSCAREAGLPDVCIDDCEHDNQYGSQEFRYQLLTKMKQKVGSTDFKETIRTITLKLNMTDHVEKFQQMYGTKSSIEKHCMRTDSTNHIEEVDIPVQESSQLEQV